MKIFVVSLTIVYLEFVVAVVVVLLSIDFFKRKPWAMYNVYRNNRIHAHPIEYIELKKKDGWNERMNEWLTEWMTERTMDKKNVRKIENSTANNGKAFVACCRFFRYNKRNSTLYYIVYSLYRSKRRPTMIETKNYKMDWCYIDFVLIRSTTTTTNYSISSKPNKQTYQ